MDVRCPPARGEGRGVKAVVSTAYGLLMELFNELLSVTMDDSASDHLALQVVMKIRLSLYHS